MSEARKLAAKRIEELAALPFDEVLRYEAQPVKEQIKGPSGRTYRSHTYAFWDMDPYDSDLFVRVDVRGGGLRWWQRYSGLHLRWPQSDSEDEPADAPSVSSTWTENFACLTLALIVLGLPLSLIYAVRRLLS